jgi:hypothetical protein
MEVQLLNQHWMMILDYRDIILMDGLQLLKVEESGILLMI